MKLPVKYSEVPFKERWKVREAYIKEQEGKCCHCGNLLINEPTYEVTMFDLDMDLFPKGFLTHPVHLHHDHDTDLTIGAVHAYCNGVLWQYHGE